MPPMRKGAVARQRASPHWWSAADLLSVLTIRLPATRRVEADFCQPCCRAGRDSAIDANENRPVNVLRRSHQRKVLGHPNTPKHKMFWRVATGSLLSSRMTASINTRACGYTAERQKASADAPCGPTYLLGRPAAWRPLSTANSPQGRGGLKFLASRAHRLCLRRSGQGDHV
jgi:hypothetical protein